MGKVALFMICAFVAFISFEDLGYFEGLPSAAKLFGMTVLASGLAAFATGHRIRMIPLALVLRFGIVLFGVASIAWSVDRDATWFDVPRVAQLAIFAVLLWEFAVTREDQLWVIRSFVFGMVVPLSMALLAFRNASQFEIESGERFAGGGQDANYMAYLCSVALLFSVYLATNSDALDRLLRWCYWGIAALCPIEVLLTGSRGGLICTVVAGVFAMILGGVSRRRVTVIVQILVVALFVYFFARQVVSTELINRITFSGGGGTSVEDDPRMRIWSRGLEALQQNLLTGVGAGAFGTAAAEGEKHPNPHSAYIAVLVELGIVGLALYVLYLVMLFLAAWRLPRRERMLWIGVLLVILLEGITLGAYNDKVTWFLYVMVLAQSAALGNWSRSNRENRVTRRVAASTVGPLRPNLGR